MKSKKLSYLFIILIIVILVTAVIPSFSYADDTTPDGTDSSQESEREPTANFDLGDLPNYHKNPASMGKLQDKAEVVLGIIRTIGIVVSVIALMAIGIKYMLGSIEEKSQYKETLKPYIIGAFLVFSGSLLPEIIYKVVTGLG